jgi:hypothetical protein
LISICHLASFNNLCGKAMHVRLSPIFIDRTYTAFDAAQVPVFVRHKVRRVPAIVAVRDNGENALILWGDLSEAHCLKELAFCGLNFLKIFFPFVSAADVVAFTFAFSLIQPPLHPFSRCFQGFVKHGQFFLAKPSCVPHFYSPL